MHAFSGLIQWFPGSQHNTLLSHVIRYRVSEENPAGSWSPPSPATGGLELNEEITDLTRQIGASADLWLMLVMLAWRRRSGAA